MMEYKGNAKVILHSAVFGWQEIKVVQVETSKPYHYAQYDRVVDIRWVEPRQLQSKCTTIEQDNICYCTIEDETGAVLYDSRNEVPFDMEEHQAMKDDLARRGLL